MVVWFSGGLGLVAGALFYAWFRRRALARERSRLPSVSIRIETRRHALNQERDRLVRALDDEWRIADASLRAELEEEEARLAAREELDRARSSRLDALASSLDARGERYDQGKRDAKRARARLEDLATRRIERLEERAEQRALPVRLDRVEAEVAAICRANESERRERLQRLEEDAVQRARDLLTAVIHRYDGESHLERIGNSIAVEPDVASAFGDPGSESARAFREQTGCELVVGAEGRSLTVRGDDPLGREAARRLLRRLLNRGTKAPRQIENEGRKVRQELEREVANAGARAVRRLGLIDVHPEIVDLIGRLKFRLSFSQNQWKHSIEVSHLTGLLAAELALEVVPARRAGLMHDMGKALTHERDGAHAIVGAEIAARCGESEAVRHAIGAHHYDEPPGTALAFLVIAADAMSGARPGARRESTTHYQDRIRDIERIAGREPGVLRIDVMQGGREVRVVVAGCEAGALPAHELVYGGLAPLPDAEVYPLAQRIARAIEAEIPFTGQIRVTVIRESRAVSIAS